MKRVLVADDNLAARKSIQQVLEMAGIEVVSVGNGDLALTRIDDVSPQMVLLDAIMPGRSGYEICAEIKEHPSHGKLPVLLITSDFEAFDEDRAARARADGHLVKPLDVQAIAVMREVWTRYAPEAAERIAPSSVGITEFDGTNTSGVDPYATTIVPALDADEADTPESIVVEAPALAAGASPAHVRSAALPDVAVDSLGAQIAQRPRDADVVAAPTTENLDADLARGAEESMVRSAHAGAVRLVPSGELCVVQGVCPACREPLAAGDVVCVTCGSSALLTLEEAAELQKRFGPRCPECNQPIVSGDIFCVSCGIAV
jgi:CheY-like chemotaxis protein